MKRKRLPNGPVKCSFCKETTAEHKIVGQEFDSNGKPLSARTVCDKCYEALCKEVNNKKVYNSTSLGEEQAYGLYKVY